MKGSTSEKEYDIQITCFQNPIMKDSRVATILRPLISGLQKAACPGFETRPQPPRGESKWTTAFRR